ncbi:MAG: LysM peptidoglycan-binding domain-containing protein [Gemmatimonadota bacterium]
MGERAAFRSAAGILSAFLFLMAPAAARAAEGQDSPAASAAPAPVPETPGTGASATFETASEAASAGSLDNAVPAPGEAVPATATEAAPAVSAETASAPSAGPAPAAAAESAAGEATSVPPAEAVPAAPAEAAPATSAEPASAEAAPAVSAETAPAPSAGAAPASDNAAVKAAEYPDGLIYTVKEGDTLWDLSGKYLGSPWLWTELWEKNRFLTNPHYIYPGIRIVIFPPPPREYAMEVTEPAPESEAAPAVAPPPPVEEEKPQVAEAAPEILAITPADYVRAGEFLERRPRGIGRIVGGMEVRVVFSEGDKVVLSLSKEIPAGQLLGVYRVRGPVRGPAGRRVSGYVKYLVGLIQAKGVENGAVVGVVRKSFEELTRNDLISEEIPAYEPVVIAPGTEGLEASVIAGRLERTELAEGDFIFLDRGANDGVSRGNTFRLFRRAVDSNYRVEVAKAVAVRVLPDVTTVYVVNSTQSFAPGVMARRGEAGSR